MEIKFHELDRPSIYAYGEYYDTGGIYKVIYEWKRLIDNDYITDKIFKIWLAYSIKMIRIVCNNPYLNAEYYSYVSYIVQRQEYSPLVKLQKCLDKLEDIEILINSI